MVELECSVCGEVYQIPEDDESYEMAVLCDIMGLDFVCAFCETESAEA